MRNYFVNLFRPIFIKFARFLKAFIKSWLDQYSRHKNIELLKYHLKAEKLGLSIEGCIKISNPLWLNLGSNIKIGKNVLLLTEGGITIDDSTSIGSNFSATSYTHSTAFSANGKETNNTYEPVYIGKNVIIENNVTVNAGIKIGNGAIIQTGSMVIKEIPPNTFHKNTGELDQITVPFSPHIVSIATKSVLSAFDMGESLFFVVGTGRSGSHAISKMLSQHPDINCLHEPKGQLIRLSTEYEHGIKNENETMVELENLFRVSNITSHIYGESDQKLSNLVPLLNKLFPKCKFIWLTRDPKKVVTSSFSRSWFDDNEFGYPRRKEVCVSQYQYLGAFSDNRINGYLTNSFSDEEWKSMSPFARNCWYWNYWNEKIKYNFSNLASNRVLKIKLETLDEDLKLISNFLSSPSFNFKNKKSNKANYPLESNWDNDKSQAFEKYCKGKFGYI